MAAMEDNSPQTECVQHTIGKGIGGLSDNAYLQNYQHLNLYKTLLLSVFLLLSYPFLTATLLSHLLSNLAF